MALSFILDFLRFHVTAQILHSEEAKNFIDDLKQVKFFLDYLVQEYNALVSDRSLGWRYHSFRGTIQTLMENA
jgi:hypothetical protein